MSAYKIGTPRELLVELRKAGEAYGHSGKLPKLLRLKKTDLIADVRALPPHQNLTWRIGGDPEVTGRYEKNRRHVVIWLGQ